MMDKSLQALLQAARCEPARPRWQISDYSEVILELRARGYTWRSIAVWLTQHGVPADHSNVYRVAKRTLARAERA